MARTKIGESMERPPWVRPQVAGRSVLILNKQWLGGTKLVVDDGVLLFRKTRT